MAHHQRQPLREVASKAVAHRTADSADGLQVGLRDVLAGALVLQAPHHGVAELGQAGGAEVGGQSGKAVDGALADASPWLFDERQQAGEEDGREPSVVLLVISHKHHTKLADKLVKDIEALVADIEGGLFAVDALHHLGRGLLDSRGGQCAPGDLRNNSFQADAGNVTLLFFLPRQKVVAQHLQHHIHLPRRHTVHQQPEAFYSEARDVTGAVLQLLQHHLADFLLCLRVRLELGVL
mmetsp:Transcript_24669/g.68638  ORF Transcript_24669/g.68638 Transcript_24669/m.68638 type:complete len:237 (+) Transcript_24669:2086-2796(+)